MNNLVGLGLGFGSSLANICKNNNIKQIKPTRSKSKKKSSSRRQQQQQQERTIVTYTKDHHVICGCPCPKFTGCITCSTFSCLLLLTYISFSFGLTAFILSLITFIENNSLNFNTGGCLLSDNLNFDITLLPYSIVRRRNFLTQQCKLNDIDDPQLRYLWTQIIDQR